MKPYRSTVDGVTACAIPESDGTYSTRLLIGHKTVWKSPGTFKKRQVARRSIRSNLIKYLSGTLMAGNTSRHQA